MPQNLEWVSSLPPALQFALFIGFGLGMIWIAKGGYLAGKKDTPSPAPKDVVLTAAGITDMKPVRDLVDQTERVADELGTIRQILAEDAEDRREYRQWRKGFEAGQGGQGKPAARRRRPS